MRRIVDAFAEYERLLIKARTRAALAVKKARRERISREAPYGWRLAAGGVHLEAHVAEQRVLELVREYRTRGLALRAIGARLEAEGHRPRSGGRWNPATLLSITRAALAA